MVRCAIRVCNAENMEHHTIKELDKKKVRKKRMEIRKGKKREYKKGLKNNQDSYGSAVFRYAERWADMMEAGIKDNPDLTVSEFIDIHAEQMSYDADTEGITGFMYGCAVSILSQALIHGEELRVWHNKQYSVENSDGVVNPACLVIGG